jgi:PAS domain S-box-containing protein
LSHSGSGDETSETKSFRASRGDQFFQRIYQQAATGIAITDWLGVFQECNPAYCALLGYTEEELRTVDFASLVHPDDREANLAQVRRLQAGEISSFEIENRYIHKNGAPVWVHKVVSVLPGENGEPAHLIVQVTNTTKRHRTEEMLRASEAKLRLALDASDTGTWSWEARTNQTQWDKRCGSMYGISGETPRHETLVACIHPEDRPRVLARLNEVRNTPGDDIWNVEFRAIRPDGTVIWIHALGRAARDADGQLLSLSGINVDITEHKQVEEALRFVSAELRQTLHTAATGLTHCSRDLRYLSANPAYAEWIGLPLEQIISRPIVDVIGQAAFEITRPRIERVLSGERVEYEDELPIRGELRCTQVVYTPDRDGAGNVVGWVGSYTDIGERKRIEEELKAANAFLDAIFENIPLMLFIKESQSLRFIRLNRISEDLLGWPNETLKGKNAYDFWPKEQAEFFIEKDRETLNRGSEVDIPEEPILTRYRGVRTLHTKKVPILDAAGNPVYLLGISEDITERKRLEKEQQFLADVSVALSTSLEYEQTLANLARLIVQNFADWCAVDVINEEGQLSRLKVASADPDQAALCAVLEQMPPDRDLPDLMRSVIESKQPIVVEQVTLQYIESLAQGPGHLQALMSTGVTSFVAVPLLMRGQALGALFLGSSTLSRVFGQNDLRLAEALADRAALAIENARLYRASVRAT